MDATCFREISDDRASHQASWRRLAIDPRAFDKTRVAVTHTGQKAAEAEGVVFAACAALGLGPGIAAPVQLPKLALFARAVRTDDLVAVVDTAANDDSAFRQICI